MNLEGIKYWFQIPLAWFRLVDRLLHTHPGDLIIYDLEAESGPLIAVNRDLLEGSHTHDYSVIKNTPELSDVLTEEDIGDTVAAEQHTHRAEDITGLSGLGFLTEEDIGDTVAAEQHTHSASDISGLPNFSAAYSGSKTVVTGVTWNGSKIVFSRETWTYASGLLTSVTALADYEIETVTYN